MDLTANGIEVRDYATILAALQAIYTNAYPGIDMTEETKEATFCRDLALWLEGNENVGLDVWVNLNLDTATGVALDFIGLVKATPRKAGTEALIDVTLTSSDQPYTIPTGQFKLLNTAILFQTLNPISVTSTTQTAAMTAVANGKTNAGIAALLQSINYVAELTNIAISSITDGTDDEDDETYRARLKTVNSTSGLSDVDAIYAGLVNLPQVTKCRVIDNDTMSTDVDGVPSKNINAIVLGDTDQNVADVIFLNKAGGTPTYGSSHATSIDKQGYGRVVYFDRPTKTRVYIACTATKKNTQVAVDGSYNSLIRQGCSGYVNNLRSGDGVSYSTIYGIFAKYNAFDILTLKLSTVSVTGTFAASGIVIGTRNYASIDDPDNDIILTVV